MKYLVKDMVSTAKDVLRCWPIDTEEGTICEIHNSEWTLSSTCKVVEEAARIGAEKALFDAARELDEVGNGLVNGLTDWMRKRALEYRKND